MNCCPIQKPHNPGGGKPLVPTNFMEQAAVPLFELNAYVAASSPSLPKVPERTATDHSRHSYKNCVMINAGNSERSSLTLSSADCCLHLAWTHKRIAAFSHSLPDCPKVGYHEHGIGERFLYCIDQRKLLPPPVPEPIAAETPLVPLRPWEEPPLPLD